MARKEDRKASAEAETTIDPRTHGQVVGDGIKWSAGWGLRISVILLALWVLMKALAPLWVAILPILLALVISSVLWPPTNWMRKKGLKPAMAASITLLTTVVVAGAVIAAIGRSFASQAPELARQANNGLRQVQDWVQGPPLNLRQEDIDSGVKAVTDQLSTSSSKIADGVLGGVTSTVSILVTLVLAIILSFFMIKDGPKFLPMLRRTAGPVGGAHLGEVLTRMWRTLGGYIRAQALVALVDAFFIGLGLVILGVPLWLPLAMLTFLGAFIPIVGAFVAGALAVLVALVSTSVTKAIIVLLIVIGVQQLEGHILQPILQSKTMDVHPALILLAVAVGSETRGVLGAFLAVPTVALLLVCLRYLGEQVELRTGARQLDDVEHLTPEGHAIAVGDPPLVVAPPPAPET
ncbi:AI-2E family transporter [Dermacoccaceae bacterium W4C1]